MLQKIKYKLLVLSSMAMLVAPLLAGATVLAQATQPPVPPVTTDIEEGLCGGSNINLSPEDCTTTAGSANSLSSVIKTALNVLSVIVGAIAVVMIIIGGFRYVASGGRQESVSGAKNTIMYALIGLVIVALAQIIVQFVLKETTGTANP